MPFRTAHSIVGRAAASGGRPELSQMDSISLEIAGFAVSEAGFSEEDLRRALDPRGNVALRANTGGPAPEEVGRMIAERWASIAAEESLLEERRKRVDGAAEALLSQGRPGVKEHEG